MQLLGRALLGRRPDQTVTSQSFPCQLEGNFTAALELFKKAEASLHLAMDWQLPSCRS